MKRYCLTLDLKNDPQLIADYKTHHQAVWTEVTDSLKQAGIENLEIYLVANRLFMVMDVNAHFSFEEKAKADLANEKVQEWEKLMWTFQKPLPWAQPGEKWVLMEQIFQL